MAVRFLALFILASIRGCYLQHGFGPDGAEIDSGQPRDGSVDSSEPMCEPFAGYRTCAPLCPGVNCRTTDAFCAEAQGVCVPFGPPGHVEPRGRGGCGLGGDNWGYCWNGDICAADPDSPFAPLAGPCLSAEYCRAELEAGLPNVCVYSDLSSFVHGPPEVSECPPGPAVQGFCGGPCGDCPRSVGAAWDPVSSWRTACSGLSETRGLGVCSFGVPLSCAEGDLSWAVSCAERIGSGRDCACLTFRGEDGAEQEVGWVTFEDSCVAYRELFPGQLECHRPVTWEVIGGS